MADNEVNVAMVFLFFIFGLGAHIIDGLVLGFDRSNYANASATLIYYLFLGILYTYLRHSNSDKRTLVQRLVVNSFISFIMWLLPIFIFWILKFAPTSIRVQYAAKITVILLITPVWLWMASDLYSAVPGLDLVWTLYLFFWVGLFVFSAIFAYQGTLTNIVQPMKAPVNQAIGLIIEWVKNLWDQLLRAGQLAIDTSVDVFNRQISYAVGDEYYVGAQEDSEGPLGVYITNAYMSENQYYVGDEVSAWIDLQAQTLDDPITINVNCYAIDDEGNSIQGDMSPSSGGLTETIYVDTFSEEFLICKFPSSALGAGNYYLVINATFNFETWANLRVYLMDEERLKGDMKTLADSNQLVSKSAVLSNIYSITNTNPVAIYTPGPVGIGIKTNSPPIGIPPEGTNSLFGVTVENAWEGTIVSLNSLQLQTPRGASIDTSSCDYAVSGGGNTYTVARYDKPIDSYKSFRCRMTYGHSALDNAPVTVPTLKAVAKYDYVIDEMLYFDVEEFEFGEI